MEAVRTLRWLSKALLLLTTFTSCGLAVEDPPAGADCSETRGYCLRADSCLGGLGAPKPHPEYTCPTSAVPLVCCFLPPRVAPLPNNDSPCGTSAEVCGGYPEGRSKVIAPLECGTHTIADSCVRETSCGWCGERNACEPGSAESSDLGACEDWQYSLQP